MGYRCFSALCRFFAAASLSLVFASCSGAGGNAAVVTPPPSPTPGVVTFTGSSITNNLMALPCSTNETFTVSQSGYSGTFQLTSPNANVSNGFTLSPTSGTSATTFTVSSLAGSNATWTLTARASRSPGIMAKEAA